MHRRLPTIKRKQLDTALLSTDDTEARQPTEEVYLAERRCMYEECVEDPAICRTLGDLVYGLVNVPTWLNHDSIDVEVEMGTNVAEVTAVSQQPHQVGCAQQSLLLRALTRKGATGSTVTSPPPVAPGP